MRVYSCRGSVSTLARGAGLDDLTAPQHRDLVGDLGDDAEIVRDEKDAGAVLAAHLADQRQDLRLRGDVERGGGLVGDEQARVEYQRHRDHDPLALPAGELMRIRRDHAPPARSSPRRESWPACAASLGGAHRRVERQHFVDLLAAREHGVERGHRLLEHHRHAACSAAREASAAGAEHVLAVEQDAPRRHRAMPAGSSPIVACAITDLPDPDSPTRQTISPAPTLMLASRTARSRSPVARQRDRKAANLEDRRGSSAKSCS